MSKSKTVLDLTTQEIPADEPPGFKTEVILLDGKGGELPPNAEPVWLTFPEGMVWENSRGELFEPEIDQERLDACKAVSDWIVKCQ